MFGLNVAFGQFTTGFEDSDGWSNHSAGDWTEDANAGTWTGHDIYASSQFTFFGSRKVGFNDVGDWLELPPVDNPGTLTFWTRLSSSGTASSNKLQVQRYDGSNWINVGAEITQSDDTYTQQSITINFSGNAIRIRIYRTADEKSHYVDDLEITIIPSDTDTEVYDTNSQPAAATISSLDDTDGEAVEVFQMEIQDQGSGDGLATKVTNIRLKPHTTNTADWTDNIQGFVIYDSNLNEYTPATPPAITDTSIDFTFTSGDLNVPDNSTVDLYFYVYLKTSNI